MRHDSACVQPCTRKQSKGYDKSKLVLRVYVRILNCTGQLHCSWQVDVKVWAV